MSRQTYIMPLTAKKTGAPVYISTHAMLAIFKLKESTMIVIGGSGDKPLEIEVAETIEQIEQKGKQYGTVAFIK